MSNFQNNYRGISLIDILKFLTGMMYKQLCSWAEEYDKIDETVCIHDCEMSGQVNHFSVTSGLKSLDPIFLAF